MSFAGTTHIGVVLDRSGSMLKVRKATIDGFNTWKNALVKDATGTQLVTVVLFNDTTDMPLVNTPLAHVNDLDETRYICRGNTALNDALAETIHRISDQVREGDRALICVITDGVENASREYSTAVVRALIREKEGEGNWTFTYLSSHPGAFRDAEVLGVRAGNTMAYLGDDHGTTAAFASMGAATRAYVNAPQMAQAVDFYEQNNDAEPMEVQVPVPDPYVGYYGGGGYRNLYREMPAQILGPANPEPIPFEAQEVAGVLPRVPRRMGRGGNVVRQNDAPPPIPRETVAEAMQRQERQLAEALAAERARLANRAGEDVRPIEYDGNGFPYPANGIGTDNSLASWAQAPDEGIR